MLRYTKSEREEAALICAIAASSPTLSQSYSSVAECLGIQTPAGCYETNSERLAFDAWKVARYTDHPDAEAEALIRNGEI